eukprot:scaffold63484_cov18-Prasinocladus_malaysianus.AAC.1
MMQLFLHGWAHSGGLRWLALQRSDPMNNKTHPIPSWLQNFKTWHETLSCARTFFPPLVCAGDGAKARPVLPNVLAQWPWWGRKDSAAASTHAGGSSACEADDAPSL